MAEPLVSVLMTSYNREDYIEQAIGSVLASTYKNFELIVCDDKSKDRTVEIVKQLMVTEPRIKLYVNQQNLGDYLNRNKAASYANGKYLKYVDSDDMIYPWGLQVLVESMEQFPEAGFGLCTMPQDQKHIYPVQLSSQEAYYHDYRIGAGIFTRAPLSSIIKKTAFEKVGGFAPLRMVGDFEMWHRLSLQFPVVLMPQGLVWYRKHGGQEMNQFIFFEFDYKRISLDYIDKPECPLRDSDKEAAARRIKQIAARKLLKYLCKLKISDYKRGKKIMKMSFLSILKNI